MSYNRHARFATGSSDRTRFKTQERRDSLLERSAAGYTSPYRAGGDLLTLVKYINTKEAYEAMYNTEDMRQEGLLIDMETKKLMRFSMGR